VYGEEDDHHLQLTDTESEEDHDIATIIKDFSSELGISLFISSFLVYTVYSHRYQLTKYIIALTFIRLFLAQVFVFIQKDALLTFENELILF